MIPVLMYHHISPMVGPHTVSPDVFREQLQWLSDSGIRTISASEFACWRAGELEFNEPCILLTFDDGWFDNWVHGLPILEEFQAKAVFFVVTSWPGTGKVREFSGSDEWHPTSHHDCMLSIGTERQDDVVMRWSELLASRDTGLVDLGCHSHGHGSWWQEPCSWEHIKRRLRDDLVQADETFLRNVGARTSHFCWPKGQFGKELLQEARNFGMTTQYTTLRGGNQAREDRLVRRINAENRGAGWLRSQYAIYSNPLISHALSLAHQYIHGQRMKRKFSSAPGEQFSFSPLRVV